MSIHRLFKIHGRRRIVSLLTLVFFCSADLRGAAWAAAGTAAASGPAKPSLSHEMIFPAALPAEIGQVDAFQGAGSGKTVFLIRDAHTLVEAQNNIQRLIAYLDEKYGVDAIGIEGAEGRLDGTIWRAFPNPGLRDRILDDYLAQGEISGSELAAIRLVNTGPFWGVERWELYLQNYRAYFEAAANQNEAGLFLDRVRDGLDRRSQEVFTESQRNFHQLWRQWQNNSAGFE